MATPVRLLRAHADGLPGRRPRLSARELDRQDRIVGAAQSMFIHFGFASFDFAALASAIRLSPSVLRTYFVDMDSLLAEILFRHLQNISKAIGRVGWDAADVQAARRAAYFEFPRTAFGAATERHCLLLHHRYRLPPDLLETVDALREGVAGMLGAPLSLMDAEDLLPDQIERMVATLGSASQPPPAPPARVAALKLVARAGTGAADR